MAFHDKVFLYVKTFYGWPPQKRREAISAGNGSSAGFWHWDIQITYVYLKVLKCLKSNSFPNISPIVT